MRDFSNSDFLGLTNLSVLADAVARVRERLGVGIDLEKLPLDDAKTYALLARGETSAYSSSRAAA